MQTRAGALRLASDEAASGEANLKAAVAMESELGGGADGHSAHVERRGGGVEGSARICTALEQGIVSLVAPLATADLVVQPLDELEATESGGPLAWFLRRDNPLYVSVPSSAANSLIAEDAGD